MSMYAERAGRLRYDDTRVRLLTLSGCLAARLRAMWEPIDQPRMWAEPSPRRSMRAAMSSARSDMVNSPSYSVVPDPRLSRVMTSKESVSMGTVFAQKEVHPMSPVTRTTGMPVPSRS